MMKSTTIRLAVAAAIGITATVVSLAQTSTFSYQGRLTDGGNPANGAFQMQFRLFDSLAAGNQIGSTLNDVPVNVSQGVFSVKLDFGISVLNGSNRWLEIAVRHSSSEFYTTLSPREQILASPYAVRTLSAQIADNALALGGSPASDYLRLVGGNLGIGTSSPLQKLHITSPPGTNAASLVQTSAGSFAQYQVQSGSDNIWTIGTQDNFSNGGLLFRNGGSDLMTIRQTGNVGIGTNSPVGKLHIEGGGLTGLSLLTTGPVSIGGYVTQSRDKGGMVKAMIYVSGTGIIQRCYNGLTGVSLNGGTTNSGCGFSVNNVQSGAYIVSFGFVVQDRFYSATPAQGITGLGLYLFPSTADPTNQIGVATYNPVDGSPTNGPFCIIIF